VEQERWAAVDEYVAGLLAPHDSALDAAIEASGEAGLPPIQVSPPQGKLLNLLATAIGATTILEFGTLGGYSTIWLARTLPEGGRLITLEADPAYADVARGNVDRAGLGDVVDLRVGPALDLLPELAAEGAGPFDLTFIVADNVVRDGELADEHSEDPKILAQRHLHEMIAAEPRVSATTIQTVGVKGYDGFTIALIG
jgi:predicted O-methyltransferase YrrM